MLTIHTRKVIIIDYRGLQFRLNITRICGFSPGTVHLERAYANVFFVSRRQVSLATVTVVAALYDERARSIITADCTVPFEQRVFRGYETGFHEKGRTHANCTT